MHYISHVDTNTKQLLFDNEVAIHFWQGCKISVGMCLGLWVGNGKRYCTSMKDSNSSIALATELLERCSSSNLSTRMLNPDDFSRGLGLKPYSVYAALAGPGAGKTSQKTAGGVKSRAIADKPCLLLSNLHNVKNTHAEML